MDLVWVIQALSLLSRVVQDQDQEVEVEVEVEIVGAMGVFDIVYEAERVWRIMSLVGGIVRLLSDGHIWASRIECRTSL
jgi:hypothetical protein